MDHDQSQPLRGAVVLRELIRLQTAGVQAEAAEGVNKKRGLGFYLKKVVWASYDHLVCWISHRQQATTSEAEASESADGEEEHAAPETRARPEGDRIVVLDRLARSHALSPSQQAALVQLALRPSPRVNDPFVDPDAAANAAAAQAQVPVLTCRFSAATPLVSVAFFAHPLTLVAAQADGVAVFWQWHAQAAVWVFAATFNLVASLQEQFPSPRFVTSLVNLVTEHEAPREPEPTAGRGATVEVRHLVWQTRVASACDGRSTNVIDSDDPVLDNSGQRVWIFTSQVHLRVDASHARRTSGGGYRQTDSPAKVPRVDLIPPVVVHCSASRAIFDIFIERSSHGHHGVENQGDLARNFFKDTRADSSNTSKILDNVGCCKVVFFRPQQRTTGELCEPGNCQGVAKRLNVWGRSIVRAWSLDDRCSIRGLHGFTTTKSDHPSITENAIWAQCPVSQKLFMLDCQTLKVHQLIVATKSNTLGRERVVVPMYVCTVRSPQANAGISVDDSQTTPKFLGMSIVLDTLFCRMSCGTLLVVDLWTGVRLADLQLALPGLSAHKEMYSERDCGPAMGDWACCRARTSPSWMSGIFGVSSCAGAVRRLVLGPRSARVEELLRVVDVALDAIPSASSPIQEDECARGAHHKSVPHVGGCCSFDFLSAILDRCRTLLSASSNTNSGGALQLRDRQRRHLASTQSVLLYLSQSQTSDSDSAIPAVPPLTLGQAANNDWKELPCHTMLNLASVSAPVGRRVLQIQKSSWCVQQLLSTAKREPRPRQNANVTPQKSHQQQLYQGLARQTIERYTPLATSLHSFHQMCNVHLKLPGNNMPTSAISDNVEYCMEYADSATWNEDETALRIHGLRFPPQDEAQGLAVARLLAISWLQDPRLRPSNTTFELQDACSPAAADQAETFKDRHVHGKMSRRRIVALLSFAKSILGRKPQTAAELAHQLQLVVLHSRVGSFTCNTPDNDSTQSEAVPDATCIRRRYERMLTFCTVRYCLEPGSFVDDILAATNLLNADFEGQTHGMDTKSRTGEVESTGSVTNAEAANRSRTDVIDTVQNMLGAVSPVAWSAPHVRCHIRLAVAATRYACALELILTHGFCPPTDYGEGETSEAVPFSGRWEQAVAFVRRFVGAQQTAFAVSRAQRGPNLTESIAFASDEAETPIFIDLGTGDTTQISRQFNSAALFKVLIKWGLCGDIAQNRSSDDTPDNAATANVEVRNRLQSVWELVPTTWRLEDVLGIVQTVLHAVQRAERIVKLPMQCVLPLIQRLEPSAC